MRSREEMLPAQPKMEAFLRELAVKGKAAVSTQRNPKAEGRKKSEVRSSKSEGGENSTGENRGHRERRGVKTTKPPTWRSQTHLVGTDGMRS